MKTDPTVARAERVLLDLTLEEVGADARPVTRQKGRPRGARFGGSQAVAVGVHLHRGFEPRCRRCAKNVASSTDYQFVGSRGKCVIVARFCPGEI